VPEAGWMMVETTQQLLEQAFQRASASTDNPNQAKETTHE
jgi:hypothetical protein